MLRDVFEVNYGIRKELNRKIVLSTGNENS